MLVQPTGTGRVLGQVQFEGHSLVDDGGTGMGWDEGVHGSPAAAERAQGAEGI